MSLYICMHVHPIEGGWGSMGGTAQCDRESRDWSEYVCASECNSAHYEGITVCVCVHFSVCFMDTV